MIDLVVLRDVILSINNSEYRKHSLTRVVTLTNNYFRFSSMSPALIQLAQYHADVDILLFVGYLISLQSVSPNDVIIVQS